VTRDSALSLQDHITRVITRLNSACFAIRTLKLFLTIENLRMLYFAYRSNPHHPILREIGWDGGDWIDLAQDRDQWRALVKAVINLRVP
jgi:hypothetical protein